MEGLVNFYVSSPSVSRPTSRVFSWKTAQVFGQRRRHQQNPHPALGASRGSAGTLGSGTPQPFETSRPGEHRRPGSPRRVSPPAPRRSPTAQPHASRGPKPGLPAGGALCLHHQPRAIPGSGGAVRGHFGLRGGGDTGGSAAPAPAPAQGGSAPWPGFVPPSSVHAGPRFPAHPRLHHQVHPSLVPFVL